MRDWGHAKVQGNIKKNMKIRDDFFIVFRLRENYFECDNIRNILKTINLRHSCTGIS